MSFTLEAAERRAELVTRLDAEERGILAYEQYEIATNRILSAAVARGDLMYERFDEVDEDWFLLRGTWDKIFDFIDLEYRHEREGLHQEHVIRACEMQRFTRPLWSKRHTHALVTIAQSDSRSRRPVVQTEMSI